MGDTLYLVAKIFGYTILIIGLFYISKKTISPYLKDKNFQFYDDKKIKIKEKIQIDKGIYLLLFEYNKQEILIVISPNTIYKIISNKVGEIDIE